MSNIMTMHDGLAVIAEEVINQIIAVENQKKEIESKQKQLKDELLLAMEQNGVKSIDNEQLKISYIAPKKQSRFDTKSLQKEMPEIYEAYLKESDVSASVRITVR